MPTVSTNNQIAVLVADIHLSLLQPACRADKDWLKTQAQYLIQLEDLARDLPILCAGDLFDRWNPPPELIHFALKYLPSGMICVAGQHDLPNHQMSAMHRSGYGVLVEAKKIRDISGISTGNMGGFIAHGFGWNQKLVPPPSTSSLMKVALIHQYCWTTGKGYPGAPEESHLTSIAKSLRGYDVAVFGDNHQHFSHELRTGTVVFNCGTFIRRKSDEIPLSPSVGILYEDGTVERHRLDTSIDVFHEDAKKREEVPIDMRHFIAELEKLGEHGLDFKEAVENHLRSDDIDKETKQIILNALDKS